MSDPIDRKVLTRALVAFVNHKAVIGGLDGIASLEEEQAAEHRLIEVGLGGLVALAERELF